MQTKNILISVIIPYYKKKNYIYSSLKSVLKQSHKKIEVIIIYDDQDLKDFIYLKKIIKGDKRVKIIINKKNQGASISRNKGIKASKGKFISFLDADDIWNKNKLAYQLNYMLKNQLIITHTNYKIINENNKIIRHMKVEKNTTYKKLLNSCDIGLSTVMINSKIKKLIKFKKITTKEDYILWLNLSKKYRIIGINKSLSNWRSVKNSLSSSTIEKLKNAYLVYNKYLGESKLVSIFRVCNLAMNFIFKLFKQKFIFKNV